MQKYKKKLFSGLFMGILLLFWVSGTEAQLLPLHQAVIPLSEMDAEALILAVPSAEPFTVAPVLSIPAQDQGHDVSMFAMALHRDWVILMSPSGWKPYTGEITMFDEVQLKETLPAFTLDGTHLISDVGESIDLFYGYAIQQSFFFGNALRFRWVSPDQIQGDLFQFSQPSVPLDTLNPADVQLTHIAETCLTISPSLQVVDGVGKNGVNLFAAILMGNDVMVKAADGWEKYYGGDLLPFATLSSDTVSSGAELTGFELPVSFLPEHYDGEIFFYYAFSVEGTKDFLGSVLRFKMVPPDLIQGDQFAFSRPVVPIDFLNADELPLTDISDTCQTIAPSLHVADEDVGHEAQLFAAIITNKAVLVKTAQGWQDYDGGELFHFAIVNLGSELKAFDLPVTLPANNLDTSPAAIDTPNPTLSVPSSLLSKTDEGIPSLTVIHGNEVLFYYAYLINKEILKGNAMRIEVSETTGI